MVLSFRTSPDSGRSPSPSLLNSPPPELTSFGTYPFLSFWELPTLGPRPPLSLVSPFSESLFCPPPPYPSLLKRPQRLPNPDPDLTPIAVSSLSLS